MGLFFKNPMIPHPLRRKRGAESGRRCCLYGGGAAVSARDPQRFSAASERTLSAGKLDALTAGDNSNPLFLIVISAILGAVLGYLMGQLAGVLKNSI